MTNFKRLLLATVCMLACANGANARSVEKLADTPKAEQASLVHVGKPLDCNVDKCKKEEDAAAPAAAKTDKPLVDASGMPTGLPTLIRGSESSQEVTVSVPKKAKPAAETSSSDSTKEAKPAKGKAAASDDVKTE